MCLSVSSDSRFVATGSFGGTLPAVQPPPGSVVTPPKYTTRNSIQVFDLDSGEVLPFVEYKSMVLGIAISPDNNHIITGGYGLIQWDVKTSKKVRLIGGSKRMVRGLCFSRDGRFLVSSHGGKDEYAAPYEDCTVRVYDFDRGVELRCFEGHKKQVQCVACSPDGSNVVSGDEAGKILQWQLP